MRKLKTLSVAIFIVIISFVLGFISCTLVDLETEGSGAWSDNVGAQGSDSVVLENNQDNENKGNQSDDSQKSDGDGSSNEATDDDSSKAEDSKDDTTGNQSSENDTTQDTNKDDTGKEDNNQGSNVSDGNKKTMPAEIVNKNGAKGVLTLISDDGDQRTSDFFHTVIEPAYDSFKVTIAIPTNKVAKVGVSSDGKSYIPSSTGSPYSIAYLDNTYVSAISNSPFKSGTHANMRDFWNTITASGAIELASHSHTHGYWPERDDYHTAGSKIWPKGSVTMEVAASAQILRRGLKQEAAFMIRPGGSEITDTMKNLFRSIVESDSSYLGMRSSNGAPPFKGATTVSAARLNTKDKFKTKDGRYTIATILVRAYEAGFNSTGTGFATTKDSNKTAVKNAGISAWTNYVDYAMQFGQWASIGFHSVVSDSSTASGYQVYDWQVKALMNYVEPLVDSGDLWLASFSDAAKYYFEWSSAELSAQLCNDEYIEVKLTDKETDERFDEALTVKLSIPSEWTTAKLTTGGQTTSLEIHTNSDGSKFVYANIVPADNAISTVRP